MTMRQKANISLLALTVMFIVMLILQWKLDAPWWTSALLFVAEAGMVGALADWFAVSALFRHPLGMKWIPHTAIVPRNRNKLVDGVVYLVEEQLLNKEMIEQQLQKVKLVDWIITWGDQKFNMKWIESILIRLLPKIMSNVPIDKTSKQANDWIHQALASKQLTPYLQKALAYLIKEGYDQRLLDVLLNAAQKRASQPDTRELIKHVIEDKASDTVGGNWLTRTLFSIAQAADAVNFDEAADIIYRDLLLLLAQLKDQDHELRKLLIDHLHQLATVLEQPQHEEAIEAWKSKVLSDLSLAPALSEMMTHFKNSWAAHEEHDEKPPLLNKWLARLIHQYWVWFKQDEASQRLLEEHLKVFVYQLVEREHKVIGKVVKSTLETFSEERLVEFIESKVEVDLQRIRVNGALIGAVIGAVLYVLFYGIYEPLLSWLL